jgi:hypothetical protein
MFILFYYTIYFSFIKRKMPQREAFFKSYYVLTYALTFDSSIKDSRSPFAEF